MGRHSMSTAVEHCAEAPPQLDSQPEGTRRREAADLRQRAVRGGAILIATRLLTQVFVWAITLTVAKLLLPFDYGVMTSGLLIVGLADLLAEAGVGKALIQKERLEPADVAEGFTLHLLLSAVSYAVLFALAEPVALWLEVPEFAGFLRVLGLLLLLVPFRSIPLALLDRELRLGKQSVVHVATTALQGGLVLGLAIAGFGYWALAAGAMAARVLEAVALTYLAGWRPRLRLPGVRARGLLAFGLSVSLSSLLWFVYSNSDFAIVGKLTGPVALGFYALAFQLISLPVQKLTANVNQVAYPVFCRLQDDRPRLRDWYLRLTVLLGCLGAPALVGMALVAEDAFALILGDKWLPAVLPFQLLSAVGVLMIYGASVPALLSAVGRPDANLKYTFVCVLVYPPCFALAASSHGLLGVCVVWLALYPIMLTALVWRTRQLTAVGPLDLLRAQTPVLAAVGFMAAAVWLAQRCLAGWDQIGLRLAVVIGVGVVAYVGWLLAAARRTVLADVRALLTEFRGNRSASGGSAS